ncbi:MAG: ArnT family glycosyltransferase [Nitrososphaeria archaeon]
MKWSILFLFPLIIRSWVWIAGSGMGFIEFDTSDYLSVGKTYVQSLLSGDLIQFSEGAWHPPLAKILIGLAQLPFSDPNASSEAAVLLLCILSASICVVTYSLGSSIGGNAAGWMAWALVSFDPGMVAWTTAWLDTPMVLFTLLALRYLYRNGGKRSSVLSGLFIALALLCKYSAAPYFLLVLILTKKPDSKLALTVLTCSLIVALNPQFWALEGRSALSGAVTSGWGFLPYTLGFALYAGPLAYPWAFLTAMGRFPAYSFFTWGGDSLARQFVVVPSAAPLVVLGLLLLPIFLQSRRCLNHQTFQVPFVWLGSAVLALALLPKSYPYYEVMLVPQAALCAAAVLGWLRSQRYRLHLESPWRHLRVPGTILAVLGCVYVALSPFAVLFRLIRGSSNPWVLVLQTLSPGTIQKGLMPLESLVAFLFTAGLAICSIIVATRFLGVISGSKRSPDSPTVLVTAPSSSFARRFRKISSKHAQDFLNTTLKQHVRNLSDRLRMSTQTAEGADTDHPVHIQGAGRSRDRKSALRQGDQ